jgi:hypothetical protein
MSMHLHHPSLSLNGRHKGRAKFRNAEEARRARELDASWKELQKKWDVDAEEKKRRRALAAPSLGDSYRLTVPAGRTTTAHIPSRDTGAGNAALKAPQVYTGTKVKGIATMHKSNAVPVFSDEEAIDISKMRR